MPRTYEKSGSGIAPRPLSNCVIARDAVEISPDLNAVQAAWLAARFHLTADRARVIAGLAFGRARP